MLRRLNELSFVIGLFFSLVAVILLGGYFFMKELSAGINLYTGIVFLIFGVIMMLIKNRAKYGSDD